MEYKICENCGAKLHVRTLKCPICNIILTDASQIINDEVNNIEQDTSIPNNTIGENIDIKIADPETINNIKTDDANTNIENNKSSDVKDYVYKAEVRHSLEYTTPLSNALKVFLTAISMIPLMGQFVGTFIGIFLATYDDTDRKSFGRALIVLSIIMFMLYAYSLMISSEILSSGEFSNYLNNFVK